MSEARSDLPQRPPPTTTGNAYNAPSSSNPLRQRFPQRQSSNSSLRSTPSELPRRRSSILSYSSLEDATNSFADDFMNPASTKKLRKQKEEEDSNWHSTPLVFAILPAVAGLLFNNGSAFVTDVLLLGFAALFMNWSIRIPRDWYYAAQASLRDVEPDVAFFDDDPLDTEESLNGSTEDLHKEKADADESTDKATRNEEKRQHATLELRKQELFVPNFHGHRRVWSRITIFASSFWQLSSGRVDRSPGLSPQGHYTSNVQLHSLTMTMNLP
jgi:hypothetical protein